LWSAFAVVVVVALVVAAVFVPVDVEIGALSGNKFLAVLSVDDSPDALHPVNIYVVAIIAAANIAFHFIVTLLSILIEL